MCVNVDVYGLECKAKDMSLPNLSNLSNLSKLSKLSLEDAKCEPCGVTKQSFSFLLPGLTPSPSQPEPVFDEKDYECHICKVHLDYPSEGFIPSDGEIYQLQDAFDDYRTQTQKTKEEKERFHDTACVAADKIRKSNPRRTQVELLLPGCGHQFHKLCLQKQVMGRSQLRNQCPFCKTPIHPTILADLKGESASSSSSSASPRGLVRERSAASTIAEPDSDDDDDESAPRAVPLPGVVGVVENTQEEVARAVQEYFADIAEAANAFEAMINQATPSFAENPYFTLANQALVSLREAARYYMDQSPDEFAELGNMLQSIWDDEIGKFVFAHLLMEAARNAEQGQARQVFTRVLQGPLPRLIQKLVPSPFDNVIAHYQLGTTWRYQEDSSGVVLNGRVAVGEGRLRMFREVELSEEMASDVRMQPILTFMANLTNMAGIPPESKMTFITLTTMLKAAMKKATTNDWRSFMGELQRFNGKITSYMDTLVQAYDDATTIRLSEEFKQITGNAFRAALQSREVIKYFGDIELAANAVITETNAATPDFTLNDVFASVRSELNNMSHSITRYKQQSPNAFANIGTLIHSLWDEQIGRIVLSYYVMEAALYDLDAAASPTGQGDGRENYTRVLQGPFPTLIRMLVPIASVRNGRMEYEQFSTSWSYTRNRYGFRQHGIGEESLHLLRSVEESDSPSMQPIIGYITSLDLIEDVPEQTKWKLLTLATILKAAIYTAVENENTGELISFNNGLDFYLNRLFDLSNSSINTKREELRLIATNAFTALVQQEVEVVD